MSKRKQCFDKLLEDYNCPDAGPFSNEAKKRGNVRRSEKPEKNFAPNKAGNRSCDKSTSDESETEKCGNSKAQPLILFYSVGDLRLAAELRHEDQLREKPVVKANLKAKDLFKEAQRIFQMIFRSRVVSDQFTSSTENQRPSTSSASSSAVKRSLPELVSVQPERLLKMIAEDS